MSFIGTSFKTLGWRYARSEAPPEPANHPPKNRKKARMEFLATAVVFDVWAIPYHSIESANLYAPGLPLQILRLTTDADVFEFAVGRRQLPSELPFQLVPVAVTRDTAFGKGVWRARIAVAVFAAATLAAALCLLMRAG